MSIKYTNIKADNDNACLHEISLNKLTGSTIKDVIGYVTSEFGAADFQVTEIHLQDGTIISLSGEHDIAYIDCVYGDNKHNLDGETLETLQQEIDELKE